MKIEIDHGVHASFCHNLDRYKFCNIQIPPAVILGLANYADREMDRRNALIAAAKVRVVPDATS